MEGFSMVANNTGDSAARFHMRGLNPGSVYWFQVSAINIVGVSEWSPVSFPLRTKTAPPDAPGKPVVTTVALMDNVVNAWLRWQRPGSNGGEIMGYAVWMRDTSDPNWQTVVHHTRSIDTERTISGLVAGRHYEFTVAALNTFGVGLRSRASATVKTPSGQPGSGVAAVEMNVQISGVTKEDIEGRDKSALQDSIATVLKVAGISSGEIAITEIAEIDDTEDKASPGSGGESGAMVGLQITCEGALKAKDVAGRLQEVVSTGEISQAFSNERHMRLGEDVADAAVGMQSAPQVESSGSPPPWTTNVESQLPDSGRCEGKCGSLELHWTSGEGLSSGQLFPPPVEGYAIYSISAMQRRDGDLNFTTMIANTGNNATTVKLFDLKPGEGYEFKTAAITVDGSSILSAASVPASML
jgi:hypothetical protein